jgi:hypothetical protein
MAHAFGLPHIIEYLRRLGLKIAHVNNEQHMIELAFHGNHGQWRMVVGLDYTNDANKLMLIVPHIATLTARKRLECLEALMAVNYRIAIGKFGLDLEDNEVRLEETIPLADDTITFEQFRLAFSAIMQTASIYHSLLPRIVYGNLSVEDALRACEDDFFQQSQPADDRFVEDSSSAQGYGYFATHRSTPPTLNRTDRAQRASEYPEISVEDVMEEVTRMLREKRD